MPVNQETLAFAIDWRYMHEYLDMKPWSKGHNWVFEAAHRGEGMSSIASVCRQNKSWEAWVDYSNWKDTHY